MSKTFKTGVLALVGLLASCQFQPLALNPPAESPAWYDRQELPSLVFAPSASVDGGDEGLLSVRLYRTPDASLDPPTGKVLQSTPAFVAVRGRSSSGWPKKSFGLETRNALGSPATADLPLLGWPSDNDFVLHALWSDKSMARNRLIYTIAAEIQDWAPRTKFVELWGNQNPGSGDPSVTYQGVYLAVEKIKAGSHRVPVELGATAADPVGGLIFQIDWSDSDTWADGRWKTRNLVVKRPAEPDLTAARKTAVGDWVVNLESLLRSTPVGDWRRYLDEASFVDFLLLNELGRNVDGYRLSTYFHRSAGGKLKAGPVWDFDLGMANDSRSYDADGWVILTQLDPGWTDQYPAFWWNELLHDAEFRHALRSRWNLLRGSTFARSHLDAVVDDTARQVAPAVDRNYAQWPSLNTHGDTWWTPIPIYGIPDVTSDAYTYADHVRSLKAWLADRLAWLDSDAAWAELDAWAADQPLHLSQGGNL